MIVSEKSLWIYLNIAWVVKNKEEKIIFTRKDIKKARNYEEEKYETSSYCLQRICQILKIQSKPCTICKRDISAKELKYILECGCSICKSCFTGISLALQEKEKVISERCPEHNVFMLTSIFIDPKIQKGDIIRTVELLNKSIYTINLLIHLLLFSC